MLLKKIRIPLDNAVEIMDALGKHKDTIEIIDLNKDKIEAKKEYSLHIKRCQLLKNKIK